MFPITLRKVAGLVSAPALIATLVVATAPVATLAGSASYFNGFENAGDRTDAKQMYEVTPVAETAAFKAASGRWYAKATPGSDVFSRLGGYTNKFPAGGYTTSIDVYLDKDAVGRFEWSSAINNPSGDHRRDFIFHVGGSEVGPFMVSVSNNSVTHAEDGQAPIAITESGWYTFQHTFRKKANGVLAVDMKVLDASGNVEGSWTLSDPSDIIGSTVGGNRYGWLVTDSFPELALDNLRKG